MFKGIAILLAGLILGTLGGYYLTNTYWLTTYHERQSWYDDSIASLHKCLEKHGQAYITDKEIVCTWPPMRHGNKISIHVEVKDTDNDSK